MKISVTSVVSSNTSTSKLSFFLDMDFASWWLHEKGGKLHTMPCHHALAEALHAYIAVATIAEDRKGFLFRTSRGHDATVLSRQPMNQSDAWRMIRRRAVAAGILAQIGNHMLRPTGITAYLSNGGALEHAQEMAAHESPRTTKLYDRTKKRLTQDEDPQSSHHRARASGSRQDFGAKDKNYVGAKGKTEARAKANPSTEAQGQAEGKWRCRAAPDDRRRDLRGPRRAWRPFGRRDRRAREGHG
jgi:hypothetical protein